MNLCKNSISPKSLGHAAIKLKIIFCTMVFSFKKNEKTVNLPYIMGRVLRNAIKQKDQDLSSCSYKTYQPLRHPRCQKWGHVDSFTSRDRVNLFTGWLPLPSWNPGLRCLELQPYKTKVSLSLLNSESLTVLCDMFSVSANLWLVFWWKAVRWPSFSPIPLHWFIGRKEMQLQWQLFFHLGFSCIVHTISND